MNLYLTSFRAATSGTLLTLGNRIYKSQLRCEVSSVYFLDAIDAAGGQPDKESKYYSW